MHPITVHPIRDILALLAEGEDFHHSEPVLRDLLRLIRVAEHFQPRGEREENLAEPETSLPY